MTQNEALQALINAANIAQQRGAYSLEEASAVHRAITVFTKAPEPTPAVDPEPVKQDKKKK
jgi:hypothetical protein